MNLGSSDVNAYLQKIGKAGGTARAQALTPRQRTRIAKLGGQAFKEALAKKTPEERSAAGRRAARSRMLAARRRARQKVT